MHEINIDNMFGGLRFTKSAAEIITAAKPKIEELTAKVAERKERIKATREEYKITDAVLIELLRQMTPHTRPSLKMSYTASVDAADDDDGEPMTVQAGIVAQLETEERLSRAEQKAIDRLQLIVRNLRDLPEEAHPLGRGFVLNYAELIFLGF